MRSLTLTALCAASWPALAAPSAVGTWKTIDDDTGKPRSYVEITEQAGQLRGRIVALIDPEEPDPRCTQCSGAKKDRPIKGLEIMWGLQANGAAQWSGGKIMDPENGKTYDCRIWLESEGELKVRGSWLFLARTQSWFRAAPPAP
ncbi:MAG: DUF2147 domain-containing protein [Myxococcota bacterium]